MSVRRWGSRWRFAATALALGGLILVVAPAVPAGAAAAGARPAPQPALCTRVRTQWARLAATDRRVHRAFQRAEALQAQLLRAGRAPIAHRLDTRLLYLRHSHTLIVSRVAIIAAKAAGACSGRPPVLTGL